MRIPSSNEKKKHKYSKGCWTKQEDDKLISYIKIHGEGSWSSLPKAAGLRRCGKSCRLRWMNYLRPDIKRGNFSLEEEDLIIKLHALLGNRWSLIAGRLPGRTDNEVKNYWNSQMKRKLMSAGIDPNNHRIHQIINITTTPPAPAAKSSASISTSTKQKPDDDDDDDDDGDEEEEEEEEEEEAEAVSTSSSSTKLNQTLVRPRAYSPAAAASIKFSQNKPTTSS